jgi:hypothetical protein
MASAEKLGRSNVDVHSSRAERKIVGRPTDSTIYSDMRESCSFSSSGTTEAPPHHRHTCESARHDLSIERSINATRLILYDVSMHTRTAANCSRGNVVCEIYRLNRILSLRGAPSARAGHFHLLRKSITGTQAMAWVRHKLRPAYVRRCDENRLSLLGIWTVFDLAALIT